MKNYISLFLFILFSVIEVFSQAPISNFDFKDSICIEENLNLINISNNANSFQWDFCMSDLDQNPELKGTKTIESSSFTSSIDIIYDSSNWYGFVTDYLANKLYKLDYSDDLSGDPEIIESSNFSDLLSQPNYSIAIKDDDVWYTVLVNNGNSNLIRLTYENGLRNDITDGVTLGNLNSLNKPFGLDIIQENDNYIVIVSNNGNNTLTLINFGSSISNNPSNTDVITIGNGYGINGASRISIIKDKENWFGFLCSRNNKIYRIDFGSTVFDNDYDIIELVDVTWPEGVSVIKEGLNYYGYVVGRDVGLYKLIFGNSIENIPQIELLGRLGAQDQLKSWKLVRNTPGWVGFSTSRNGGIVSRFDFDDKCIGALSPSNEIQPQNISYSSPGSYSIELTAYDEFGNYDTHEDTIFVKDESAPSISYTTDNLCIENTNQFIGTSSDDPSITSWSWDFGNTETASGQNVSHQFDTVGTYNVSLSIESDNGCANQIEQPIRIYEKPVPAFSVTNPTLCSNSELDFVNESEIYGADTLISYSWNFNDEIYSSAQDTSVVFDAGGTKTVTLSATIPGCTSDETNMIDVVEGPAVSYSHEGNCENDDYTFENLTTGQNITGYSWDFGDGYTSDLSEPSHLYTSGGTYHVSLTASNSDGCNNVFTQDVVVGHLPVPDFAYELPCSEQEIQFYDQSAVEEANICSYHWTIDLPENSQNSTEKDPLLYLDKDGLTDVKLSVTSTIGCTDSISKSVEVLPSPTIDIEETLNCVSDSSVFQSNSSLPGGSILSNSWMIENNFYATDQVKYLFAGPGDYDITLTSRADNLCENTLIETFTIAPLPSVDFETIGDCENEYIQFNNLSASIDDPIIDFRWSIDNELVSLSENFSYLVGESGSHDVLMEVTTERDCENSLVKSIDLNPAPISKFTAEPVYGAPPLEVDFNNQSTGATRYLWDFSQNNEDTDNLTHTSYTYQNIGNEYPQLIAINDFNCRDTSDLKIEIVDPVLDVSIESITQTIEDNKVKFIVRIFNYGTMPLDHPELRINFDNQFEVFEMVAFTILPNSSYAHQVNFELSNATFRNISNVCMELLPQEEGLEEENVSDNVQCVTFGDEMDVIEPYPNPVSEVLQLPIILKESSPLVVQLMNSSGNLIKDFSFTQTRSGLNMVKIDLRTIASGTYYLLAVSGGESVTKKIVVR